MTTADALKGDVQGEREAAAAALESGRDGRSLAVAHARFLEKQVAARFAPASAAAGLGARGVALAAVGSLGRGAVALRSDADLVVLVDRTTVSGEQAAAFADALLYPLWDATLAVGHQVLAPDDALALAATDLPMATALLDLRVVAGDPALADDLVARAREGLFAEAELGALLDRLEAEAAARHGRFGGSVYLLEPDVKSGQGGLRDLDGVLWAARARYRVDLGGEAGPWGELVRIGVLVAGEAREIAAAEELLWRVRNRLHGRAGRKADRLGFEEQEALAVAMGHAGEAREEAEEADEVRARAAERLMQDYYRQARTVTRARESLFERLRPVRRRSGKALAADLGGGVRLFDGHVTLAGAAELQGDPPLALRVYAACVSEGAPVLPFARDAIARAAADPAWCARLRESPEAASRFVELVCTVPEARTRRGSVVGELHDVGLLLAMVPEFLPVTGRVHHDVYHVYTVDVHSVAAVDRLRQLARGELGPEFPLASRLAAEIARPRPLFLATLLHDVGKGWPDATGSRKNHSKTGADLCDAILPRLGFAPDEVAHARELVAQHLAMYHVATRRDLDDPTVVEELCRAVQGREGLRDLYLLTVADLSTTSPTAMTSWKARMLDELYFAAEAHLSGRPEVDAEGLSQLREAAARAAPGQGGVEAFLASMPERYLLSNAPEAIAEHARVAAARQGRAVHVERVRSRHAGAVELCVVARDRPGLLAALAAALTANRLEVLAAQVCSRATGDGVEAVDLFWVRDARASGGRPEGVQDALPRLARDLEDLCAGRVEPGALLAERLSGGSAWRERPSPAVPIEVHVDGRASPRHTVVEVFARDRPGLLYRLARALHGLGLTIALSKINTEGTRVADVFYVNEADGAKIADGARARAVRDALVAAASEG